MASILLNTVATSAGAAIGGPVGGFLGSKIGGLAGSFIDGRLFGGNLKLKEREGARLADLGVQASTYGKMIPIVYGTVRIAGNVIWSRPIRETVTTSTTTSGGAGGKGGGGGRVSQTSTTYSYSVSLAIAICEGEIDSVLRVWADAGQLDLSQGTYRIYYGTETQLPDSFIQGFEGADDTPAYRGLAYIVIEDFPLENYGNRIPNFTFEINRKAQYADYDGEITENMVGGMIVIPGAGEFVYDTTVQHKIPGSTVGSEWVQQGNQEAINAHTPYGVSNAELSLDYLKNACPNVGWVGVVVSWFGTSTDAGACLVQPGVEYQSGGDTTPDTWGVAGYTRSSARLITQIDGAPQYGGTPDDAGILRYLDELKARGYNILFYPMLFMDVSGKPWRGELTGSAADVAAFFTKTEGYNAFVNHYASLVKDKVDAFVIGSEMIGLTKVTDTPGNYPGVNALVSLAASVKTTMGSGVKLTYAADWSEYHHTDGGWYNLDPLWASANIDVIGIDAYFPLKDDTVNTYDVDTLISGWTTGEGVDYYYTDTARTTTASLSAPYAWKNIQWWWENTHTNPDTSPTAWIPESKPIWFTEFGFPSVDNAANQPNVFFDPSTAGSAFPYHSKGRVDFRAQRAAITATLHQWAGSSMIEQMFLWTWDARPYPYWPDLTSVWADGAAWKTGHWVQGKFGVSSLAAIVADLCDRAGLDADAYNVSRITDQVEGYVILSQQTIRQSIAQLQGAYFFDHAESDYVLKFIPRGGSSVQMIDVGALVPMKKGEDAREVLQLTRAQEIELPKRVNVIYLNRISGYQPATQYSERAFTESREIVSLNLPIVIPDQVGKNIADVTLYSHWVGRTSYRFKLPIKYGRIEPADIITIADGAVTHSVRVTRTTYANPGMVSIEGVAEDVSAYDFYTAPGETQNTANANQAIAATKLELLDMPALPGDSADSAALRLAAVGYTGNWRGSSVFRSDDGGSSYELLTNISAPCIIGTALDALGEGVAHVFDEVSTVTVSLYGVGELASASELAVLNGANAAMIGGELIQFRDVELLEPGKYRLSNLLRGRLGTDHAMTGHAAGERFIVMNSNIVKTTPSLNLLYSPRQYKPVSGGATLAAAAAQSFTYTGVCFKPFSPAHVAGSRDGSGNLTLNWVRRARISGDWLDYTDVPLNETSEAYEVDIMNGVNVVRTIGGLTTAAASYSAAEQTVDFGSPQSTLTVRVTQLSAIVGRGYAAIATI